MAHMPASTIYTFAYFMNGEEFLIELLQDMRCIRFKGRDGELTQKQGRYNSLNRTLFGWFNYKGPEHREKFFSVTLIQEMDGKWALEGMDEEKRRILMRPLRAHRGGLLVHDDREIINGLFGYPSILNPMDIPSNM